MARHALRDERDAGLLQQRKERNERWKALGPRLFGIIYYRNLVLHLLPFSFLSPPRVALKKLRGSHSCKFSTVFPVQ